MHLHFVPIHVFRGTPQVSFFDAGVNGSNSADVVIHHKNAFDQTKGFSPVSLRSNKQLREAKQAHPVYWIWEEERIKRVKPDRKGFSANTKEVSIVAAST